MLMRDKMNTSYLYSCYLSKPETNRVFYFIHPAVCLQRTAGEF